jgi:hypothetical protein
MTPVLWHPGNTHMISREAEKDNIIFIYGWSERI